MRILCTAVLCVLVTATVCRAQDVTVVTAEMPVTAAAAADVRRPAAKVTDKKFWALAGALNTAMLLDTKSTFDVSKICPDCGEANPFVRPFVRRGPVPTYIAGELFDAGVMAIAGKMKGSDRLWVRRTWWVIPVALVTGHSIAYRHNVNLFK